MDEADVQVLSPHVGEVGEEQLEGEHPAVLVLRRTASLDTVQHAAKLADVRDEVAAQGLQLSGTEHVIFFEVVCEAIPKVVLQRLAKIGGRREGQVPVDTKKVLADAVDGVASDACEDLPTLLVDAILEVVGLQEVKVDLFREATQALVGIGPHEVENLRHQGVREDGLAVLVNVP
eukprot:scaffold1528_cov198-Pinguiococcus_pyrenoidosus.AAC.21